MNRPALLLAAPLALCFLAAACSAATPSTFTVHGTVTLDPLNGVPPLQAYGYYTSPADIQSEVNITADDGPGNYSGQPWREVVTNMTLESATAKVITYTFTAQVPDDALEYQIGTVCCTQSLDGGSFTFGEMQAGPALCFGDGCPPGSG